MVEAAGVEPASEDASTRTSTCVGRYLGLVLAGNGRPASATSQRCLDLHLLTGQEVQPDCVGVSWLQTEAPSTVAAWFIRPREQLRRYRSQLQGCPFLRGLGRHDARSEHRQLRRNRYAP